jgi:hypothetical protein
MKKFLNKAKPNKASATPFINPRVALDNLNGAIVVIAINSKDMLSIRGIIIN